MPGVARAVAINGTCVLVKVLASQPAWWGEQLFFWPRFLDKGHASCASLRTALRASFLPRNSPSSRSQDFSQNLLHHDMASLDDALASTSDAMASLALDPKPPSSSSSSSPYRFEPSDPSWTAHLLSQGFVVLAGVADREQVASARAGFWDAIEAVHPGVDRGDMATW